METVLGTQSDQAAICRFFYNQDVSSVGPGISTAAGELAAHGSRLVERYADILPHPVSRLVSLRANPDSGEPIPDDVNSAHLRVGLTYDSSEISRDCHQWELSVTRVADCAKNLQSYPPHVRTIGLLALHGDTVETSIAVSFNAQRRQVAVPVEIDARRIMALVWQFGSMQQLDYQAAQLRMRKNAFATTILEQELTAWDRANFLGSDKRAQLLHQLKTMGFAPGSIVLNNLPIAH